MILSQNDEASTEVRGVALSGLQDIRKSLSASSSVFNAGLSHEIDLFLRDPKNNTPRLRPSGAPPGPPV